MLAICTCSALLCAFAAAARGRVDERLAGAGELMLSYGRTAERDQPRSLLLNGVELHVLSGRSADGVDAVLDTFETRCANAGGAFAQQLAGAPAAIARHIRGDRRALLDGVLRSDDGERGYVACFDLGGVAMHAEDLVARLRAFAASGDLSAIGDLRFAWAQRAHGTTSYVALWSEGQVPLRAMFPARGDAPGVDVPGLPRPASARRVLCAQQLQRAPLVVAYASANTPAVFETAYRAQLHAAGVEVRVEHGDDEGARAWLLRRGAWLGVAVIARGASGGSTLALSPLR